MRFPIPRASLTYGHIAALLADIFQDSRLARPGPGGPYVLLFSTSHRLWKCSVSPQGFPRHSLEVAANHHHSHPSCFVCEKTDANTVDAFLKMKHSRERKRVQAGGAAEGEDEADALVSREPDAMRCGAPRMLGS